MKIGIYLHASIVKKWQQVESQMNSQRLEHVVW